MRKPCARLTMGRELAMAEQLPNQQECGTVIVRSGWPIPWQGQHGGALFVSRVSCSGLCEMLRNDGRLVEPGGYGKGREIQCRRVESRPANETGLCRWAY